MDEYIEALKELDVAVKELRKVSEENLARLHGIAEKIKELI